MNRALDLHKSGLAAVVASRESVIVKLRPGYVYEGGEPGKDPRRCVAQDIDVTFGGARLVKRPGDMPVGILDGTLLVSGAEEPCPLRLPVRIKGTILLNLLTEKKEELCIEAAWAESTLVGTAAVVGDSMGGE